MARAGILIALAAAGTDAVVIREQEAEEWHGAVIWQAPALEGGPCDCLSWKQVYKNNVTKCGSALELRFSPTAHLQKSKYCGQFYEKLDQKACVNTMTGTEGVGQWCYVSSACTELNGGRAVKGADLSYKMCKPYADDKLGDHPVEELAFLAQKNDMDLALAVRMAYPQKMNMTWGFMEEFMLEGKRQYSEARKKIVGLKKPLIFKSSEGEMPFYVVHGERAYKVFSTDYAKNMVSLMRDPASHAAAMSDFECLVGCPTKGKQSSSTK